MQVKTFGSAVYGVDAATITAEISVELGTKYFLVGLPDNAVKVERSGSCKINAMSD